MDFQFPSNDMEANHVNQLQKYPKCNPKVFEFYILIEIEKIKHEKHVHFLQKIKVFFIFVSGIIGVIYIYIKDEFFFLFFFFFH